ncbi:calcium-binding protein [Tautonia rosea]|uniref:calcium-binding protein n=1 Tax=Tautonia rosea TaxID=2728037 RepID=UPI001475618A|nr:calcium-binding protein [Tautonia rosea]
MITDPSTAISELEDPVKWTDINGTLQLNITYTFNTLFFTSNSDLQSRASGTITTPVTTGNSTLGQQAFDLWGAVAPFSFSLASDPEDANIGILGTPSVTDGPGQTIEGASFTPFLTNPFTGYQWIHYSGIFMESGQPLSLYLHEIGHSLGLDHPKHLEFGTDPDYNTDSTIMSYNSGSAVPTTPMIFDIATLQKMYGANQNFNATDTSYTFTGANIARTIWDGGGEDTLDASQGVANAYASNLIDLRAGFDTNGNQFHSKIGQEYVFVAYHASIENAKGGLGNDTIHGNSPVKGTGQNSVGEASYNDFDGENRLEGMDGEDTIYGYGGDDTLIGGANDEDKDTLIGGKHFDTYIFTGTYGADIVDDEDGKGVLEVDGLKIKGDAYKPDGNHEATYWELKIGSNTWRLEKSNGDLVLSPPSGDAITIKNFHNGKLSIRLEERDEADDEASEHYEGTPYHTPLFIDLGYPTGDLYDFLQVDEGSVWFDLDNTGFAQRTAWLGPDDGFIVRDRNSNGEIDNITEMFGNDGGTSAWTKFRGLDDNSDGVLDASDTEFANLRIWRDLNSNGHVDSGELNSLSTYQITGFEVGTTDPTGLWTHDGQIVQGNLQYYVQGDPNVRFYYDVLFETNAMDTWYIGDGTAGSLAVADDAGELPMSRGYGELPSLHYAYAQNSALHAKAQNLMTLGTGDVLQALQDVEDFLTEWAGTYGLTGKRGAFDADTITFLEKAMGVPLEIWDGVSSYVDYVPTGANHADERAETQLSYSMLYDQLKDRLLAQSVFKDVFIESHYDFASDRMVFKDTLETVLQNASDVQPEDAFSNLMFWQSLGSILLENPEDFGLSGAEVQNALTEAAGKYIPAIEHNVLGVRDWWSSDNSDLYTPRLLIAEPDLDFLYGSKGSHGDDIFIASNGKDELGYWGGNDIYYFAADTGENRIRATSDTGTIYFGPDISYEDISVSFYYFSSVWHPELTYGPSGEKVRILTNQSTINYGPNFDVIFSDNQTIKLRDLIQQKAPVLEGTASGETLSGNNALVRWIKGLGGDDTLNAGNRSDALEGGTGNDTLNGNTGWETFVFTTGDGQDTVTDTGGAGDVIHFNDVSDPGLITITQSSTNPDDLLIDYGTGDRITIAGYFISIFQQVEFVRFSDGTKYNLQELYEASLVNLIEGTEGVDNLVGTSGNDHITALGGNDTLEGGAGADILDGGGGTDYAKYQNSSAGVTVNLATGTGSGGEAEGDTYTSIEYVTGSAFADVITGNDSNNRLEGGAGDDELYGGNGNDSLFGGDGADILDGGSGSDYARYEDSSIGISVNLATGANTGGDAEGDIFVSIENVHGSDGADTITGDAGDNRILGFDGNDTLNGGDGIDWLYGDAGDDQINGGSGNDHLFGGAGADIIDGGTGGDFAQYDDSNQAVTINLATGVHTGGHANGDIYVNINNIRGSQSSDTITGSSANNILQGAGGDDQLFGGAGSDTLMGGSGADTLDGGSGFDFASYGDALTGVTLDFSTGVHTGDAAGDTFTGFEGFYGSIYADTFIGGGTFDDFWLGGSGNDSFYGNAGTDKFTGGFGADHFDGGSGQDTVYYENSGVAVIVDLTAGTGTGPSDSEAIGDTFVNIEHVTGSHASDTITGNASSNTLSGGNGYDTLYGMGGNDVLYGGSGFDTLDGGDGLDWSLYEDAPEGITINLTTGYYTGFAYGDTFISIEKFSGTLFDDVLIGDAADQTLRGDYAGNSQDTLNGMAGNDTLIGGQGDDLFVFHSGHDQDVITDFLAGGTDDTIELSGFSGVSSFSSVMSLASQVGSDTVIDFGNGDTLTLSNVTLGNLTSADFTFA